MSKQPLVSIVIPVFNNELYLAEALESVLVQSYHPYEIIVVDDGSTDNSPQIARSFSAVNLIQQENQGAAAARNAGIKLAQGDFLAFLDADDFWVTDKLRKQVNIVSDQPDLSMVFGHIEQFITPELKGTGLVNEVDEGKIIPGYAPSTAFIRRELFATVGLFNTQWRIGEFIDWYMKAQEKGHKSFLVGDVLARRRIHNNNLTSRQRSAQVDYVHVLKSALDRRRRSGK